jgi:hypothetical protein
MRLIILLTVFCFSSAILNAQSSVVYKRNPATGILEVYQSQGGLPTGSPIYKIKKNVYGYLEVENVDVSTDPFTRKPDYTSYNNFKPYQLPAKEIFETLETLNKRTEYDKLVSNPPAQNSNPVLTKLNESLDSRTKTASSFLKFYSSVIEFPKSLKDGWYNVIKIFELPPVEKIGIKGGTDFQYGICLVKNNKVIEYYENINILDNKGSFVYKKVSLALSSNITNLKATYKPNDFDVYETLYFLDNIIDINAQAENPNFSFYSVFTPTGNLVVYVLRNTTITADQVRAGEIFPYLTLLGVPNPSTYSCNASLMTLAFKKSDENSFSIGIMNLTSKAVWLENQVQISSGSCKSILLNQ